jgi:hypothetical protein
MRWLSSSGGPRICGEEHISMEWKGIDGLSANSDYKNDYERGCSTREYLEKMTCAGGCVLVLGDEPLQSTFFRTEGQGANLTIARWVYAVSSEGAEDFLKESVADVKPLAPAISFDVAEGKLVLMDSVMSWSAKDLLTADIEPGSYLVTTEQHQLDNKFSFIVHRFLGTDRARSRSLASRP